MYIFGYLRASTRDQNARRAQSSLLKFVHDKGFRIAGWYIENESGASLQRPELLRLLNDAEKGDAILIEQIDRLSRMDEQSWSALKGILKEKELRVISLDLPTSHTYLTSQVITDEFTRSMINAINSMMMDMLAAIARKDYQDRRRRQLEGIQKAKEEGKYQGRKADLDIHEKIYQLRVINKLSIHDTAKLTNVSDRTVIRVVKKFLNV